jgi:hypothetical protein
MSRRDYTRRAALRTLGLSAVAAVTGTTDASATIRTIPDGRRDDERIQFVEADPEAGFNYPYLLGTPETFRSTPVPLLVTMNSAREGMPLTADGSDDQRTVAQRARTQIQVFEQVGPWVSERLGIPQLVPVFPLPDGDPVDNTHKTLLLDRETMLIEGTDLERIDRQLLRMTEHARQEILGEHQMHDKLLFWGNSSGGVAAEHMAVLHPEEIMAFAGAGINGIATLPLETLGSHTLNYPVGVADLDAITGSPFNAEAFDGINKFYVQGGRDTHDRLKFHEDRPEPVERTPVWNDPEVYATAKAVYGRDMVADRLPRCHIAFEKAGISGQFRVYPEMTHDPEPAGPDVLEFLRRSIEGEDVSEFGQALTLPFDRTVTLQSSNPRTGDQLRFDISGDYPPLEGLVTYTCQVSDGRTQSGPESTFAFEESGRYDLALEMETAHGQFAQRGMSLLGDGASFAAFRYAVSPPPTAVVVGERTSIGIEVTNIGAVPAARELRLLVGGTTVDSRQLQLDPAGARRVTFEYRFEQTGTADISVPPAYRQTLTVTPKEPEFVLDGVEFSTREAVVGEPITVTATVKNGGTGSGKIPVALEADGERLGKTSVTLAVDETETVTFKHAFDDPGNYTLTVNNEYVGTVTVKARSTRTSPVTSTPIHSPTTRGEPGTTADTPGFGVVTALAGIGIALLGSGRDAGDE